MTLKRRLAKLRIKWRRRRRDGFGIGVICSLAFHGALIAIILWHPHADALPPNSLTRTVVVELVQLGNSQDATGADNGAAHEKTLEAARPASKKPVPRGEASPDNLGELLRRAETAHGAVSNSSPHPDAGAPRAVVGASGQGTAAGAGGRYGLKDLIRAQIERRWEFTTQSAATAEMIISIRLVVDPDGSVSSAEAVIDPERSTDRDYLAAAMGARNAALLSSPLQLPPGAYGGAFTVDLNTKDALR